MKNKNVGFLIVGIAIIIGIIIAIFNFGLRDIVSASCTHGSECSMYGTIKVQTWTSLAIAGLIAIIGLFFIFSKEEVQEKIVVKKIKVNNKTEKKTTPIDYTKLDKDEKTLMKLIEEEKGAIFQSTLVEKSQFNKVKVSRILDRLEGRQLLMRKRRGMTNIVILKN